MKTKIAGWILCGLCATAWASSPFPALPGHGFVFETDFTSSANWDLSAGAFVSHAQAVNWGVPTGGTIVSDTLTFQNNGSAVLNLTDTSVLGESFTVLEDQATVYLRLRMSAHNCLITIGLGNDEAMIPVPDPELPVEEQVWPDPALVRVAGGSLRINTNTTQTLRSAGVKPDFSNLGDASPTAGTISGSQATGTLNGVEVNVIFDMAVSWDQNVLRVYTKTPAEESWTLRHTHTVPIGNDPSAGQVAPYESQSLVLYMPANGTAEIFDLAISVPMAPPPEVFLALPLIDETGVSISVETETGFLYQLQRTTNLLDPLGWQNIGDPLSGTGNPVAMVDTEPEDLSIYRVVLLDGTP